MVEPRPSFTKSHSTPQQRAIFVPDELLAPRFSQFQSHRALQVLVESSLVLIRLVAFGFGDVRFEVRTES